MARSRFHPPARASSRAKEVSPSRQSPREPPRRRPKSPARAARSSAAGKQGFLAFPRGRAERALLTLASLASKRAKATNIASCSSRAQLSPWAALTNAPSVSSLLHSHFPTHSDSGPSRRRRTFSVSPPPRRPELPCIALPFQPSADR
jgi:hypothetical protein